MRVKETPLAQQLNNQTLVLTYNKYRGNIASSMSHLPCSSANNEYNSNK